jgi:hypothetical protein
LPASAILLAIAPLFMSEGSSVVEQPTSESAGQLVLGSWVARTGFLCFGFAALWLARSADDGGVPPGRSPIGCSGSRWSPAAGTGMAR